MTNAPLTLDPDRLFPIEPRVQTIARGLYSLTADLPILSPHGHVSPSLLLDNEAFGDPTELFITHDHYVTRLLHAAGIGLDQLGVGTDPKEVDPREVWRRFCENWHLYYGTASGYWLTHEFTTLFDIDQEPSASTADEIYDHMLTYLQRDEFRPRALFERFSIELLATTDDPMDDLSLHDVLAADPDFHGRVIPTFRPDAYLDPTVPGFQERAVRLTETNGSAPDDFAGYLKALEERRAYFIEHGAISADHGVREPLTLDLPFTEAATLYRGAVAGTLDAAQARAFTGHMLFQMARMSVADGLVMTLHPGVARNHSTSTYALFGPDTGHDIPLRTEYTENLQPLLNAFGLNKDFHLILFGVDETIYSREVAPLAGFYPSVYIGAPWWFLDAPDAVLRFRSAVTETAGFYRGAGFIDDTRAFLSIPARHDMARRLDASFLARLVGEGRLTVPQAERIAVDLVDTLPRQAFKI